MDDYQLKERIDNTEYLVEADDDHFMYLWRRYSTESDFTSTQHKMPQFKWEQVNPGVGLHVGTIDDRPIMVAISWNLIDGALIGFYYGMSQLVDHKMIEEFLAERFKEVPRCNTTNFHRIIHHIQNRDKNKVVDLKENKRPLSRQAVEDYERDGVLTTRLLMDHGLEKGRREYEPGRSDPEIDDVMASLTDVTGRLDVAVEEFTKAIWAPWLKAYYREQEHRGLEANVSNVNVLVWGCAGRVMVSLRRHDWPDESQHLTLIGADSVEDTDSLGIQGIGCNGDVAIELVKEAARLRDSIEADIGPNQDVGMG